MKYSTTGYKDNSPDKNEGGLMIPGNLITMKGVSKQLTLIPIVGGKPQHGRKRIAKPGDSDIQFESDVESVLELPYAQVGPQLQNPYVQNFIDNQNSVPKINTPPPAYFQPPQGNVNMNPAGIFSSYQSLNTSGIDPNLIQQKEAQKTTEKQKDQPFQGAINPYGGWNMENSATALGAFIEDKNLLGTIGSSGKLLLSGARNALGGAAGMKRYNEAQDEYESTLEESERRAERSWFQKGGKINNLEKDIDKYSNILSNIKILKEDFDASTNEYIITYE